MQPNQVSRHTVIEPEDVVEVTSTEVVTPITVKLFWPRLTQNIIKRVVAEFATPASIYGEVRPEQVDLSMTAFCS